MRLPLTLAGLLPAVGLIVGCSSQPVGDSTATPPPSGSAVVLEVPGML